MRIIICGGRQHPRFAHSYERAFLDDLHALYGIDEVITGGAPGADAEGDDWARNRGIDRTVFPANWSGHGRQAGPLRNERMAAYLCAHNDAGIRVVAFPGNKGTAEMITTARAFGIPVLRYPEDWDVIRSRRTQCQSDVGTHGGRGVQHVLGD